MRLYHRIWFSIGYNPNDVLMQKNIGDHSERQDIFLALQTWNGSIYFLLEIGFISRLDCIKDF